jgi:hypothetical protein
MVTVNVVPWWTARQFVFHDVFLATRLIDEPSGGHVPPMAFRVLRFTHAE